MSICWFYSRPDDEEINLKKANDKEAQEQTINPKTNEPIKPESPQNAAPVPQIKLGPQGEIILDEQSLVSYWYIIIFTIFKIPYLKVKISCIYHMS